MYKILGVYVCIVNSTPRSKCLNGRQ